jgi:hypothetical protein
MLNVITRKAVGSAAAVSGVDPQIRRPQIKSRWQKRIGTPFVKIGQLCFFEPCVGKAQE